jgi:hypothetical protein
MITTFSSKFVDIGVENVIIHSQFGRDLGFCICKDVQACTDSKWWISGRLNIFQ